LDNRYLTSIEAAARLRVSPNTLANWRSQKNGPPYLKIGGRIRYASTDLESWLSRACRQAEPQPGAGIEINTVREDDSFLKFLGGLPRRAQTVLRNRGITSFSRLAAVSASDFKGIPNCGARTIERILAVARRETAVGAQKSSGSLDDDIARLVKSYGVKRVLSSVARLAPE
jgi:predicted flap endonuclease-1-like 5' DNA nuclease